MRAYRQISVRKQVALFAFTFLYLFTAILSVYAEDNFSEPFLNQNIKAHSGKFEQEKNLVFTEAASVNASGSGILSEKEFLILPVIYFLALLLFLPVPYLSTFIPTFFRNRTIYLFRILPNAP